MTPFVWLTAALMIAGCAFAAVRGGPPERITGFAMLACSAVSLLLKGRLPVLDPVRTIAADGVLLGVVLALVLRYRRAWLQPFAGAVVLAIASSTAFALDARLGFYAFATVADTWMILQIGVLCLGTYEYGVARRRNGQACEAVPLPWWSRAGLLVPAFVAAAAGAVAATSLHPRLVLAAALLGSIGALWLHLALRRQTAAGVEASA